MNNFKLIHALYNNTSDMSLNILKAVVIYLEVKAMGKSKDVLDALAEDLCNATGYSMAELMDRVLV